MRLVNRVLSPLLAVALAVLAVLVGVEVVAAAVGAGPVWVDWPAASEAAGDRPWNDGVVRAVCGALAVVGLLLLLAELKPRRPSHLPVRSTLPGVEARVTRHGLLVAARTAATGVDGVSRASARIRRRSIQVTASSRHADRDQARALSGPVQQAVTERVDRLELARRPTVRVRVQPRGK